MPIVRTCRLGTTQRTESSTGPVQAFEMTLSLIEIPGDNLAGGRMMTLVPTSQEAP